MSIELFGTDGIRGKVNTWPMTVEIATQVAKALAKILNATGHGSVKVVVAKDPRRSGYMFESALEAGLNSMGADVYMTGPIPTPTLAWMIKAFRADAGIMITASHNPAEDNGFKIFNADGFKLTDQQEKEIEELVLGASINSEHIAPDKIGKTYRLEEKVHEYVDYAKSTLSGQSLEGLRVVLDTANGAARELAQSLLDEMKINIVYHRGDKPDGDNINAEVGVAYVKDLAKYVKKYNADLAICLDGDADRVIFIDEKGKVINGDYIIGLLAIALKEKGQLKNDTIVVTQMSNLGLLEVLDENVIQVIQAPVGDRYVIQAMKKEGCNLGGEQSGHIIFLDHVTTGDGLITALQVMSLLKSTGKTLSELTAFMTEYPQLLQNVRMKEQLPVEDLFLDWKDFRKNLINDYLAGNGRIFLRYSGTEKNLLRVMVEAKCQSQVDECMVFILDHLKNSGFMAD